MATIRLMEKLDGGQTSRDFGNHGDIVIMGATLFVKETVESAGRATKQYILNKSSQNLEFRNKIIMIADKLYKWMCKLRHYRFRRGCRDRNNSSIGSHRSCDSAY